MPQRLVPLVVEAGDADAPFCASVFADDERVGLVGSSGFGHTLQKSLALAFVRSDLARPGTAVEVEIFGERCRAIVATEPPYDPGNERLRA